ncbi:hypothetical protein VTN00DRAFT_1981 [Thermoascus crustaceus]|uniref:uncharacterized protein n=1 Tax=Thermoascus crustaceus TaxID=5088 RepID=UPI003744345D
MRVASPDMEAEKKEQPAHVSAPEETHDPEADTTPTAKIPSDAGGSKQVEKEVANAKDKEPIESVASVESSYSDIRVDQIGSSEAEPFPDYYESCEGDRSTNPIDKKREAAYNYAISKVVEEVIRFRELDASIISLTSFTLNEPDDQNATCAANVEKSDQAQQADAKDSETSSDTATKDDTCSIIKDLKDLLASPKLKLNVKKRFTAMVNMVLRMSILLFHPQGVTMEPKLFLGTREALEVKGLAAEILRYLAKIDQQLKGQVEDADRVAGILSNLAQDKTVSVYVTFRRMAYVVISRNLRKPRPLERRLLTLFLELYDAYVYNSFLQIRNRQIIVEDDPDVVRLELSRLLIALWDILNRVIENYEAYIAKMKDMKRRYFEPAMQQLQDSPEIWRECWMNYQLTLRPEEQPQPQPQPSKEPEMAQSDVKMPTVLSVVEDVPSFSCHF